MNLKQLEAFVWVSDLGSFRRAAERLNTTQPNISIRISALEDMLKVRLMERDAGSVRLTGKGHELLEHARLILTNTENLIAASENTSLYEGVLKLGVTELIVHTWLREFMRQFKEQFSNITVELTVDLSSNLKKDLATRSIDLAFQNGPFAQQTSGNVDLGSYPLIWIASPSIAAEIKHTDTQGSKDTVSAIALAQHPILTHARNTQPFEDIDAHFKTKTAVSPRIVPSSNLASCLHMTLDGMGVAALPAATVADELARGNLMIINYDWAPRNLQFLARYDADKTPAFVAAAADLAGQVATAFTSGFVSKQ